MKRKLKKQSTSELVEAHGLLTTLKLCDIERRRAEEKLRRIFEFAPDAMVFVDKDGKIILVNKQTENLFGYSREELIEENIEILMPERFRSKHRQHRASYFLNPRARHMDSGFEIYGLHFEIYGLHKNGKELHLDISLSPIEIEEGLLVLSAIRDISEKKIAEEKIRHSNHIQTVISSILQIALEDISLEEQLKNSLDLILSIPWLSLEPKGCIYLIEGDPEMLVMKAQRGFPKSLRVSCEKVPFRRYLYGRTASECKLIFPDSISNTYKTQCKEIFSHGYYCVPIITDDQILGAIHLALREEHKRDQKDEEFLSSVADAIAGIIKHKQTELENQKLQEKLIQSEKLLALGRLTANVAHEIRNPLTIIGGFTRLLNKGIHRKTKEKEYTEIIISEVSRLEKILKNVLTLSKNVCLHAEEHNINKVINESLRTYEGICKKQSIDIKKLFGNTPQIRIDKERVRQVIDNLILNAINSMPNGGTLTIATNVELVNGIIYVVVKITDEGEGIEEDKLSMIFEPFFTTKSRGHFYSTGLGLSTSKKIMDEHHGLIIAESDIRRGSTFSLYFPYQGESGKNHRIRNKMEYEREVIR